MPKWSNWSTSEQCSPAQLTFPRSVDDVSAIVRQSAEMGRSLRAAGAGHSHYRLIPTDGTIVDTSGLAGVISADAETGTARVWAGTPIYALGRPLHDAGVALANQGDIDRQAIGGAVATGTHGTGTALRNLSASVTGLSIVTADGSVLECSSSLNSHVFEAARLGLGAFGVVTQVELAVVPAYRLAETGWQASYDELRPQIDELNEVHRHFEFFWSPRQDIAAAKRIDVTDRQPEYPIGEEGTRCGWNYEVLPNYRPHLHTEMEYAVPAAGSLDCLDEVRALLRDRFTDVVWPVEYRRVAADDVWMSQAFEQETATISVHQGIDQPNEPFFRACEEIFVRYGGRPHWGKVHYLDGEQLAAVHPRWSDWWAVRDAVDPDGVFLNDRLTAWRPALV